MRFRTLAIALPLLLVTAVQAKPTKSECKAHTVSIKDVAKRLGLSEDITGRAMMTTVEAWLEEQDEATIEATIGEIEMATQGIRKCGAGGFYSLVQSVKTTSVKLEAVLPWLQNAAAAEPCQALINEAVRKRATDVDGAIADLERSIAECKDDAWLPEAHGNLAVVYFERGSVEQGDFEKAYAQLGMALSYSEQWAEDDRKMLRAILAKPMIETGGTLMDQNAYGVARSHWKAYIDIFGTASFDVLFDVETVARGSWHFRDLLDARFQLALACLELDDVACATDTVRSFAEEYKGDSRPMRELTTRALGVAAAAELSEQDAAYKLALELLDAWHDVDPDSYQIKSLVEEVFLPCARDKRLHLLELTEACWIPMQVAECLNREGEDYVAEAEMAASCDSTGSLAAGLLAQFHFQTARDTLDRVVRAGSTQEKRALLREVEEQLLPQITDPAAADQIRAGIAAERTRLRNAVVETEQNKTERFAACTELLALIQWNQARENDYDSDLRDFRRGCCGFLMDNTSGWDSWMRSRPAETRLGDDEIANKEKLMSNFCSSWGL